MPKTQEKTYRSEISAATHGMVEGFHRTSLVDKPTLREFDANCLALAPILSRTRPRPSASRKPSRSRHVVLRPTGLYSGRAAPPRATDRRLGLTVTVPRAALTPTAA